MDFCASCEEKVEHPHAFLKIARKEQVPSAMLAVIDEDYCPEALADLEHDLRTGGPLPGMFGGVPAEVFDDEEDLYS